MNSQILFLYFITWFLVALTPGPAVICSIAQATRYGFWSSLAGVAGIQLGNFLFFVCIAFGPGTLLATATTVFTVLRMLGAIYLFYLGIRLIASTFSRLSEKGSEHVYPTTTPHTLFLQGLLIQVTNAKALLFMSALLPQFIEPHRPIALQFIPLAFITIVVDAAVLSSYAFLAKKGVHTIRTSRLSTWLQRVFGAALLFFGFRLLLSCKLPK